eukprot:7889642-Lingulodinium_polyedra.AAC.1
MGAGAGSPRPAFSLAPTAAPSVLPAPPPVPASASSMRRAAGWPSRSLAPTAGPSWVLVLDREAPAVP